MWKHPQRLSAQWRAGGSGSCSAHKLGAGREMCQALVQGPRPGSSLKISHWFKSVLKGKLESDVQRSDKHKQTHTHTHNTHTLRNTSFCAFYFVLDISLLVGITHTSEWSFIRLLVYVSVTLRHIWNSFTKHLIS